MCVPAAERGGGGNGWADGLTGGALRAGPEPPTKTIRRAAPGAGLGHLHCRVRELLWSRRPLSRTITSRTLNGLSALVPSPMSVAATVRRLLPPVALRRMPETRGLRWPGHIRIAAVPFPEAKIRGGGWQSGDRSTGPGLDESGSYWSVAIRDGWETGTAWWPVSARWPEGPCDGCEAPVSDFRRPRHFPVFLPSSPTGSRRGRPPDGPERKMAQICAVLLPKAKRPRCCG